MKNFTRLITIVVFMAVSACTLFFTVRTLPVSNDRPANNTYDGTPHFQGLTSACISNNIPQQIIEYKGFTVNFNAFNRTPNYVAWELLGSESKGDTPRHDKFWRDETVKNCPSPSDYTRSGFDRGHMYPAADAKWDEQSMYDCFSMSNVCPQRHALNSGAWKTLEEKERLWARRDSAIVIIAGPIYNNTDKLRIGPAGVRVPSAFFKALIAPYVKEPRGIAFVYPNDRAPGNMQLYAMSIDDLEKIIGFDLFHRLPDDLEQIIESTSYFNTWDK